MNESATAPLAGINVLLTEDNELNILVASKFLEKWGAKVTVARNGLEATQKFQEDQHHLVLMDLHMPVMDGYQATRHLRQQGIKVPIIALTASVFSDDSKKIKANGFSDIVIKPFEPKSFLSILKRSIEIFFDSDIAF